MNANWCAERNVRLWIQRLHSRYPRAARSAWLTCTLAASFWIILNADGAQDVDELPPQACFGVSNPSRAAFDRHWAAYQALTQPPRARAPDGAWKTTLATRAGIAE
ncbi:MAG: hypothetical protein P8Y95_01820 [Gammaproteobacteria bacterium]|jgi:hypothetical protein